MPDHANSTNLLSEVIGKWPDECKEVVLQHLDYLEQKILFHCENLGISREDIDDAYMPSDSALSCELQIEKALKSKNNAILALERIDSIGKRV